MNNPAVSLNFSNINYESDPILARIKGLNQQNVGNAETEATALRNQAIIDSGLVNVGQEIGVDANTLAAASNNPLSAVSQLGKEHSLRTQALNESLNNQNLFFSGHRANQLSELEQNRMAQEASITGDLRSALGGINAGVMEARSNAAMAEQEALERAAEAARIADLEAALLAAMQPPTPGTVPDPVIQQIAQEQPSNPLVQQYGPNPVDIVMGLGAPITPELEPSPYPYGPEMFGGGTGVPDAIDTGGLWYPSYEQYPGNADFYYQPEPTYVPPPPTIEEELLLALGVGNSAFTNYAI